MAPGDRHPPADRENGEPPLPPDTVACLTIEGLQVIEEMLEEFRDAAGRPVSFDELCDAFRAAWQATGGELENYASNEIFAEVVKQLRQ